MDAPPPPPGQALLEDHGLRDLGPLLTAQGTEAMVRRPKVTQKAVARGRGRRGGNRASRQQLSRIQELSCRLAGPESRPGLLPTPPERAGSGILIHRLQALGPGCEVGPGPRTPAWLRPRGSSSGRQLPGPADSAGNATRLTLPPGPAPDRAVSSKGIRGLRPDRA